MGLLEKLWDDTVAGPRPDSGLGRLRKEAGPAFSVRTADLSKDDEGLAEEPPRVTRSIMIRRPPASPSENSPGAATPPESPAGSATPPLSPFFGPASGGRDWNRFRRRSMSDACDRKAAAAAAATTPPTVGMGSREI